MKKSIFFLLFLLIAVSQSFALITTDNVDKDSFGYQTPYLFATSNLSANQTTIAVSTAGTSGSNEVSEYVVPRAGSIVGLAVTGNANVTTGAATFDVTINGELTGIQAVINKNPGTFIGTGSSGIKYAYARQDRSDVTVSQGTKDTSVSNRASFYSADYPFGRATPLVAGDRIGVKVNSSLNFTTNQSIDYVATVYVLN